jgi:branched-chain amino acid transport system substrate-binding protein
VKRALGALALFAAAALVGCGGGQDPLRLGIQVDCQGAFTAYADPELGGAFLPLLQRGARLVGPGLEKGVENVRIAGRPVEVKVACTETAESTYAVPQLRTLLEEWHPDVVVGSGLASQDGFAVRDLAKRYPDVTFLNTVPTAQQITLSAPAPNLFRFTLDNVQSTAGLGSYAYRVLGWRRAAVVTGGTPDDWEEAAGFTAEFCALGGQVTRDDGGAWVTPAAAAAKYARSVDGIAAISSFSPPTAFLKAVATSSEGAARRLVLGGWAFEAPTSLGPGATLEGAVVGTTTPRGGGGGPAWQEYVEAYEKAYPGLPPGSAAWVVVPPYRNAVEAIAQALTATGGDIGPSGERLRSVLAKMTAGTVPRSTRLDANRQAVSSVFLARIGKGPDNAATARTVRVVNGVEQTFGGIFTPRSGAITATTDACRHGMAPPPWAS